MSNTPDGSGARPLSPHHLCATTHSSVLKIAAHRSGRKWLASSSSSVEQTGEVVKAKRGARRRHWHCAAIWRSWSKNDITWRLGKYNKRRRRRTLVVCCRLTDHLGALVQLDGCVETVDRVQVTRRVGAGSWRSQGGCSWRRRAAGSPAAWTCNHCYIGCKIWPVLLNPTVAGSTSRVLCILFEPLAAGVLQFNEATAGANTKGLLPCDGHGSRAWANAASRVVLCKLAPLHTLF